MTLFFLLAALLVVVALALLLAGPLRARAASERESDLRATNIALARERRDELAGALADGAIDADTHERELARVERELAAELDALPERTARDGGLPAAVLVAVFVPLAAGALYLQLGDPGAVTRDGAAGRPVADAAAAGAGSPAAPPESAAGAEGGPRAPALSELLPRLEERLAREPDDVDGWRLLGRSYLGIDEFARAEAALRRAVELDGDDLPTLGQLAEAIAMERGGDLSGEPTALLDRVLAAAPEDPQGLWLRAIAHQQANEHETALAMFSRLRANIGDDAGAVQTIDAMMARSREAGGTAPPATAPGADGTAATAGGEARDDRPASATAGAADGAGPPSATAAVSLTVDLSPEARADAQPGEAVFVYARATDGPPMPLAVARYTVADLPIEVTLDESMAMMPAMSLASFPNVTVGARVSKTGNAIAAPGDWFAEREGVAVAAGDTVELVIDARRP